MRVRLFDERGIVSHHRVAGGFALDTSFQSTGWRSANVDLSAHAGDKVTLRLDAGGTHDRLLGFWVYLDAGSVPVLVSRPGAPEVPAVTPTAEPVLFQTQHDVNGLTYYNFAGSSA